MSVFAASRSRMLSPITFRAPTPKDPHVAGGATRRSRRPDWVLLHKSARISGHRNATTAGCHTMMEGQAIHVSFWLVDPPGVSYFSVHCPGLDNTDFADEPHVLCAEAALVLFSVTFVAIPRGRRRSTQHFVYRAGPGKPSLQLIPDPDRVRRGDLFALLPFDDGTGHYAVVFLNKQLSVSDMAWRFDVHAFSSVTQSWSSSVPSWAYRKMIASCCLNMPPASRSWSEEARWAGLISSEAFFFSPTCLATVLSSSTSRCQHQG